MNILHANHSLFTDAFIFLVGSNVAQNGKQLRDCTKTFWIANGINKPDERTAQRGHK